MKVNTKLVCAASLAALLTVGMATPSYAAPADRASFVAQSVAAALKGLGGLDAKARARLLGAVVSSVAGKGGLSGDDLATAIAQAVYDASAKFGLGITPRMAADLGRTSVDLADGTVITIKTTDGKELDYTVIADGDGLTSEDDPVSAG